MWISKKVFDDIVHEVAWYREQIRYLEDKCNRLTEALTKKDTSVVVRLPEAPMVATNNIPVAAPSNITEAPDQFVENWFPEPKIATPPREKKVNSPD